MLRENNMAMLEWAIKPIYPILCHFSGIGILSSGTGLGNRDSVDLAEKVSRCLRYGVDTTRLLLAASGNLKVGP